MTQKEKLPDRLLDDDGYPTKGWLEFIRQYKPDESLPIESFVEHVLPDGWWMPDWGYELHRKYKGKRKLELHTGGWSGNEEVIREILGNFNLTHFKMRYTKWYAGGHYYFEINISNEEKR